MAYTPHTHTITHTHTLSHTITHSQRLMVQSPSRSGQEWPRKKDDFLPYRPGSATPWSGIFTSRPSLKRYIREAYMFLRGADQMLSWALLGNRVSTEKLFCGQEVCLLMKVWAVPSHWPLWERSCSLSRTSWVSRNVSPAQLRRAVSVVQHHDAITGTEKQHVAFDYSKRIACGLDDATTLLQRIVAQQYQGSRAAGLEQVQASPPGFSEFHRCPLLNVSICQATQSESTVIVHLYNTLGYQREEVVRLPVEALNRSVYTVYSLAGDLIPSAVVTNGPVLPAMHWSQPHAHPASHSVAFKATVPAFGHNAYLLNVSTSPGRQQRPSPSRVKAPSQGPGDDDDDSLVLENAVVKATFSKARGGLVGLENKETGAVIAISQSFEYYRTSSGSPYSLTPDTNATFPTGTGELEGLLHWGHCSSVFRLC